MLFRLDLRNHILEKNAHTELVVNIIPSKWITCKLENKYILFIFLQKSTAHNHVWRGRWHFSTIESLCFAYKRYTLHTLLIHSFRLCYGSITWQIFAERWLSAWVQAKSVTIEEWKSRRIQAQSSSQRLSMWAFGLTFVFALQQIKY